MAKKTKTPVGEVPDISEYVRAAAEHPLVRRVVEDAALRENIRDALERSRNAYARLSNGKSPVKALTSDKRLQRELKDAATSVRNASTALREGPTKAKARKRGRGLGRGLLFAGIAGGLALVASEGLRSKVLDTLFGAEEEFDYTSTTTPATPAAAPSAAADASETPATPTAS